MCGITGILNLENDTPISENSLRQMLGMIRHRGPDGFGIYLDDDAGLGSARLSIIDLSGGDQPISNEDGSLWIVFNGEIFNYIELRPPLEARGHQFTTQSDTEVVLHLYEDFGPDCLKYLNGQFAMAIWDTNRRSLFLARDRLGIRPLYYTRHDGKLIFGSEIKCLFAGGVPAAIDPLALDQIFTYWSTLSPRSAFQNICDVPAGHYLLARDGKISVQRYWALDFIADADNSRSEREYLDEYEGLLVDATRIRLRADVPVGAYLSGGLDSSTIAAIIRNYTDTPLDTFSIAFSDPEFDESQFQQQMAKFLGTQHQVVFARHADIGEIFPQVIWHTEAPILRTAPAPMYLLSGLVRENQYKVVLTGEGADEFLAGYDIFKEAMIRRFWARRPDSHLRPLLLQRLYPEITRLPNSSAYLSSFFREGLADTGSAEYSHAIRWRTTQRAKRFFTDALQSSVASALAHGDTRITFPAGFEHWHPLSQAQWLEATIFLPQYLLSSQGDRPAMAHSVEGRFPFLDYRVVEFSNRLPPHLKLFGLKEKYLLKRLSSKWLPDEIWQRRKRPYRAPIHRSFFGVTTPDWVRELLTPGRLRAAGFFKPEAVSQMVQKLDSGKPLGETDDMALAGILSTQLVYQQFIANFRLSTPAQDSEMRKVYIRQAAKERQ
ncbi:MAG: asparagine synthase (glutamine-hydrolyzing) [Chloroflexi bacterium RBG_16_52_11]|nr:MAG: asparagine synthase (glutamine-hydrolyzing) [Chloroflexi bacterium RBG_16_52_11]